MPVYRGSNVTGDVQQALQAWWEEVLSGPRRAALREAHEECLAEMLPLLRPGFAYESYPVAGTEPGALILAAGHRLNSPVVARLFAKAGEVVLLAFTIGPLVEARVEAYRAAGAMRRADILDAFASLAVNVLGRLVHEHVKRLAGERGLRASIPFNPGTSHWPISDQRLFLELVPASEIGLNLGRSNLLEPLKSISMAIAFGSEVLTDDEGSSCDYCAQPDLCRATRDRLFTISG